MSLWQARGSEGNKWLRRQLIALMTKFGNEVKWEKEINGNDGNRWQQGQNIVRKDNAMRRTSTKHNK